MIIKSNGCNNSKMIIKSTSIVTEPSIPLLKCLSLRLEIKNIKFGLNFDINSYFSYTIL